MKSLLAVALLILTSTNVFAEWTGISTIDSQFDGYSVYVDNSTIRPSGSKIKMWDLVDFQNTQEIAGYKFMSIKTLTQYDCKDMRSRDLAKSVFGGNMGSGDVIFSDKSSKGWDYVEPKSVGETKWKLACNKSNS